MRCRFLADSAAAGWIGESAVASGIVVAFPLAAAGVPSSPGSVHERRALVAQTGQGALWLKSAIRRTAEKGAA